MDLPKAFAVSKAFSLLSHTHTHSMFFGNLFVYYQFQGKTHIDQDTRTLVFSVLIGVGILGFFFLTALRPIEPTAVVSHDNGVDDELERSSSNGVVVAFKNSLTLFFTREMLLLSLCFFYTGKSIESLSLIIIATTYERKQKL